MAQNVVINGVTYQNAPEVDIPKSGGGTAKFYDTSDADAEAANILAGKDAYGASGKVSGSMAENGAVSGTISTKTGQYTIPEGHHNGSGKVGISSAEQDKIIAGNIRGGVTILGQAGKSTVVDTEIASDGAAAGDIMAGKKAYVGGNLVTGNATVPTVSQDSTTKILTIS